MVKWYPIKRDLRRCNLGFSTSSRRCVLRIGISGLWSVVTRKCCRPAKNTLHLVTAQQTASISNSITAYHVSASDKNRDPAWTRFHSSPVFCYRINPRLCLLASMLNLVGLVMSKKDSSGEVVSDVLMFVKAS